MDVSYNFEFDQQYNWSLLSDVKSMKLVVFWQKKIKIKI